MQAVRTSLFAQGRQRGIMAGIQREDTGAVVKSC